MDNQELEFERARFEYILKVYANLNAVREGIEKKASFELLIIALLLGSLFANVSSFTRLNDYLMSLKDIKLLFFSNIIIFMLAVTLLIALVLILIVLIRGRSLNLPPRDLLASLYFPDSESAQHKDTLFFFQKVGVAYSVLIETTTSQLTQDALLCRLSAISLVAAILILGMLLVVFTIGLPVV